jgi:hypothetical protein
LFRRPDLRYSILLFGLSVLVWLPRLQGPIDLRYDAGVYYILGTSLAQGKGYRLLNEPGEIEAIQYTPLLAAMVAIHQRVLGTSDPAVVGQWLRLSFFLIFLGYVLAVYRVARHYLAAGYSFLVGLITALYLHGILLSDLLFAELPMALMASLFILCNRVSESRLGFLLTALCGVAVYLLRSAGIALFTAWIGESLLRKKCRRAALQMAVALIPIIAWQAYTHQVASSPGYRHPAYPYQRAPYQNYNIGYVENILLVDTFQPELGRLGPAGLCQRLFGNLTIIVPAGLGEGITAGKPFWTWLLRHVALPSWPALLPGSFVGALVIWGVGVWLFRRQWFFPLYIAASVVLMCLTPWPGQFNRYLTPLTPWLALALVQGLVVFRQYFESRWSMAGQWWGRTTVVLVLGLVLGTEMIPTVHAFKHRHEKGAVYAEPGSPPQRLFFYDKEWRAFDAALAWLREQNRRDAVLTCAAPHWAYLKTGLKGVMPPLEVDTDQAQSLADSVPITYVIVDELDFLDVARRYAAPMIQSHSHLWRLVYTVPESKTSVYQRVDQG